MFNLKNNKLKYLMLGLTISTALLMGGCEATTQSIKEAIGNATEAFNNELAKQNNDAASSKPTSEDAYGLKQAGIYDIFVDAPYDESQKSNHQWPRVAIEVLSSPSNINDFYAGQGISGIPDGCFEMQATIWKSSTDKTISKPFQFCFATDIAWGVALLDYENWASRWDITNAFRNNNGSQRKGPMPPDSYAPDNIKYKRHFSNAFRSGKAYSADSVLGIMLFSVAAHAGIDPSVSSDHRLWFTQIAPL